MTTELPPWAKKQRRPPEARPTWVVVLALAMMVFGGGSLIRHRPDDRVGAWRRPNEQVASADCRRTAGVGDHGRAAYLDTRWRSRVNGVSKVTMGLLMLFAVAAVFASDPRARTVSHGGRLGRDRLPVRRRGFSSSSCARGWWPSAPALVSLVGPAERARSRPHHRRVISALDVFIVSLRVLGVLFSVVLLTFFGGKRGRSFFGVGPRADMVRRQPHHGG